MNTFHTKGATFEISKKAEGFTLTEMLVVITVVAILVILIFSPQGNAGEKARRLQCLSNLRQIASALQQSSDGNCASLLGDTTNTGPFIGQWPWDMDTNVAAEVEKAGVTREVLYCPSNADMDDEAHWNFWKYAPASPVRVLGYIFLIKKSNASSPGRWRITMLSDQIAPPSDAELSADAVASTDGDYTRIQGKMADRTSHLEGTRPAGGNIAFEDGHGIWRPFGDMKHRIRVNNGVVWDY